ncbi:MAG TPA: hypothetical protein VJ768_10270 [Anaerolineales bacterium]|nr:hypothetical protein [Anaerolineales bacterium]
MGNKTFYTDRDIEDLARQGVSTLEVNEDVYLTDLAREKADRLGVRLVREHDGPSAAPVRPYLSEASSAAKKAEDLTAGRDQEMFERVRAAVIKRVGQDADTDLIDTIIRRVLANIG